MSNAVQIKKKRQNLGGPEQVKEQETGPSGVAQYSEFAQTL